VTKSLIFIGCRENALIEVIQRKNMQVLKIIDQWRQFGDDWSVVEHLSGKQVFLFVPILSTKPAGIGYVEFLVNDELPAKEQYVYQSTLVDQPMENGENSGDMKLAAGSHYLFAHFEKFNFVVGYTICDYRSTFDIADKRNCPLLTEILPQKDHHRSMFFSLDSFSRKEVHSCGDKLLFAKKDHYQKKLDFLCSMENARTDWKVIIFSALVGLIILVLTVICCLAIYYCCCKK